jgi:hypothetical protein
MTKKISKVVKHNVRLMGTIDLRFEVSCKDIVWHGVQERPGEGCARMPR